MEGRVPPADSGEFMGEVLLWTHHLPPGGACLITSPTTLTAVVKGQKGYLSFTEKHTAA